MKPTLVILMVASVFSLAGLPLAKSEGLQRSPVASKLFSRESQKIIGGVEIEEAHPITKSVAALINVLGSGAESDGDETFEVCTASFISNRVLLTAAHCLPELADGEMPKSLYVKIGVDAYGSGRRLKVDRVESHPDYNSETYESDVAVIRLEQSFDEAVPLKLVRPKDLRGLSRIRSVQAIGFGRSNSGRGEEESYEGLGRMRTVDLRSVQTIDRTSGGALADELLIQVDMNHGQGFCEGDSGGPALLKAGRGRHGIIGVASTFESRGGSDCNRFGYYTNVLPHLEWITGKVREIVK